MQGQAYFDWQEYLDGLVNYEARFAANYAVDRPSVKPFMDFLTSLGSPNLKLNTIIIAGSKGKGSTAASLEAMFLASGRNVGLYTSPHVINMNERVRACGVEITDAELASALSRVAQAADATNYGISWFEAITSAAFLHFSDKSCDPVILEVGLGGRLDSTNVTTPHVALISNILLEHTAVLGKTTALIAYEKANVMKQGTTTISVAQDPDVTSVLTDYANSVGSAIRFIDESAIAPADGGIQLTIDGIQQHIALCFDSPVLRRNNILAAFGYMAYCGSPPPADYGDYLNLRGRYERGSAFRLSVLLDGAHTPESLNALLCYAAQESGKIALVFACLDDKRVFEMLDVLLCHIQSLMKIVFIRMEDPRAVDPDLLCGYVRSRCSKLDVSVCESRMLRAALTGSKRVIVTGSFRLLREFVTNSDYTISRDA